VSSNQRSSTSIDSTFFAISIALKGLCYSYFMDVLISPFSVQELIGNVEHFITLKRLQVDDSKVESIFCLNEINEQEMNLGFEDIDLYVLPMMTCLFVKN
jgi:hypothetical protein